MEGNLGLSEERLHILKCFLDPENMIKMEEVPNPLNPNAEVLEYSKDGIRPKQPPSNAPKTDPIWEFFNPTDAHEGMLSYNYYLSIKTHELVIVSHEVSSYYLTTE